MSNNTEIQTFNNSNDWINLIEDAISKKHIKYYDHKDFHKIEKIGNNNFEEVYRTNWKNSKNYFVLKSFNFDNTTIKEVVHEFELYRKVNFHKNIIQFFGITDKEIKNNGHLKKYLLVTEYADGGSLQSYLKVNFKNLTWEDKYNLAFQLTCVVSYLHDNGIVHHNLHSGNILVHQNIIKLANFGLSKRIKEVTKKQKSDLFGIIPYIDPKRHISNSMQSYSLDEKSDVYSIGVLLWEISSGQPPFKDESYDASLITRIVKGYREKIVSDTPIDYFNLYTECWNDEPDNRPAMNLVVTKLKAMITETIIITEDYLNDNHTLNHQLSDRKQFNLDDVDLSNTKNSLHEILFHIIQNFNKINIKEIEPTIQNINKVIFEEDLSIVIDELVNHYIKEINEGIEEKVRKQHILDYLNNYQINLQEIYDWLLNNQNSSNSIYSLGYFNFYGIGTYINMQKAIEFYQRAVELEHIVAQFELASIYILGKGIEKDYNKAFELSKKVAEIGYSCGINRLGYCYYNGIGTEADMEKAFELYQKATNLGNISALHNLAHMYKDGEGVEQDDDKAFELFKITAKKEYSDGIAMLGYCYYNGIGTEPDMEKAFELYQKAADLGNSNGLTSLGYCYDNGIGTDVDELKAFELYLKAANMGNYLAQYNLALTYEEGSVIKKDMDQAIYWYKQSAKQEYQNAQYKLEELLNE